ncbi:protein singed-like [Mizuhopecten yessoensis]|uniref:Protein singed n=1 Tax=Mizuhopecten yessoensis TaxID=6573 RepID=A0A210QVF8_MIZYE|nr:protein singed-like [Mizuhopecten yessoensis]OWF52748.1 Protein singed [Mizuhopecten yessoensis]
MSQTNGCNGHSKDSVLEFSWKVGLLNCKTKYLTAESFGKLNITGTALKKKQVWTLEHDRNSDDKANEGDIYLRSPQTEDTYVSSDKYGNVKLTEKGDDCKFRVEYGGDKYSGLWAFRNVNYGTLLGTAPKDEVTCFQKGKPAEMEYWTVQLSIHPQVNIRNINRKRYAHLCNDELQCTEVIPWGAEALIILEFHKGKYALKTSDDRYLNCDGTLSTDCTDDSAETKFTLEIRSGKDAGLAFKDCEQRYLTSIGSTATMKARNMTVTKDELFSIEDSHPQVLFISEAGKMASIKQGVDISANQTEESETETFQTEYLPELNKWAIRTCKATYWAVVNPGSGIQANSKEIKDTSLFDIEWQGDGTVGIKAHNGKYVSHKSTGAMAATADALEEKERYKVKITNRPQLILRCQHGFVGPKSSTSSELVCNKASATILFLEGSNDGTYAMKDSKGKYWSISEDSHISPDGDTPTPFTIEFLKQTIVTIKGPNGRYLKGEQNGNFRVVAEEVGPDTYWEF